MDCGKKYVLRARPPDFIYQIAQCLSGKVSAIKFTINSENAVISKIHPEILITLSKAHIVKASVTNALSRLGPSPIIGLPTHSDLDNDALFYNGLYADQNYCCLAYLGSPMINQSYLFTNFPFESVSDL
jgi:hypothetical protein